MTRPFAARFWSCISRRSERRASSDRDPHHRPGLFWRVQPETLDQELRGFPLRQGVSQAGMDGRRGKAVPGLRGRMGIHENPIENRAYPSGRQAQSPPDSLHGRIPQTRRQGKDQTMNDIYMRLTYEQYKQLEEQLANYKAIETTHRTVDGGYHKAFRLRVTDTLILEF